MLGFFAACLIGVFLERVLNKGQIFCLPPKDKALVSRACGVLRKYYGLTEPYVLTKCFACSDEDFVNRDVCLFYSDSELRITVDIVNGFADGCKDLGCYVLECGNYSVKNVTVNGKTAAEISAGKFNITVGCRASKFAKQGLTLEKRH